MASHETTLKYPGGATRSAETIRRINPIRALSSTFARALADYISRHRDTDAGVREDDNWKKGIPLERYEESLGRHYLDFWTAVERGDRGLDTLDMALAVGFNIQGWVHRHSELVAQGCSKPGGMAEYAGCGTALRDRM